MAVPSGLSADELQRYARHLTLPEVGVAGQERLAAARVLLVGAGGLGSPAALYLAAAGIGHLGIIDSDVVDLSNLQRQVLHGTNAIGMPKVESARRRLADLNPHVTLEPIDQRLTAANARELVRQYDVVLDGSDNFPTRYLVNDACVLEHRPLVYGSIYRFEGQLSVFATESGPCYRCLFAEPPAPELVPSCVTAGVLGVLPGIIGTFQALEVIKLVLGVGEPTAGRLLLFDALTMRIREVTLRRDPDCIACGTSPQIREPIDYEAFCGGASPSRAGAIVEISPQELGRRLEGSSVPALVDVREPWEFDVGHIAGALPIPLGQLAGRLGELPTDRPVVTICHHGPRSLTAAQLLIRTGFGEVVSLAGGMDAWAVTVDPAMRRY